MTNIANYSKKNNNLILLPRLFSTIFTSPKYTAKALDVLILLAQNGVSSTTLRFPKNIRPSYIKSVVVPFLATLKVGDAPLFDSITYNNGKASISYQFSQIILSEFDKISPTEEKKGGKKEGYIIVNVAEFLSLKGLYTKQLYLSLCSWQKGQTLDLYRSGKQSIFARWQLPKSYRNGLLSQVLKPAMDKINKHTSLHILKVQCWDDKFTIIYKRLTRAQKKRVTLDIEIDRYPYVPLKVLNYGGSIFAERKPWGNRPAKKEPTPPPRYTVEAYYLKLLEAGFDRANARDYTNKKYKLEQRHFASRV